MQYRKPMPEFLEKAAQTPALQRLKDVGMHCGCQYTDFPRFRGLLPYSRFRHSMAVARILWDFTGDPQQALTGLFHDAATPVFSHVVDFLNGDHMTQESTEEGLQVILKEHGIAADPSRYPLADAPSPRLCADRLEYTLSNGVHYGFCADVQYMYDDLLAQEEFIFATPEIALDFANMALNCGKVYVCDEDRYAMERLSRVLRKALEDGCITRQDLYTTESQVIQKLPRQDWESFCRLSRVFRVEGEGEFSYRIPAKKRYIDPMTANGQRVTALFPEFKEQVEEFLACSQDYYICGE